MCAGVIEQSKCHSGDTVIRFKGGGNSGMPCPRSAKAYRTRQTDAHNARQTVPGQVLFTHVRVGVFVALVGCEGT